MFTDEQIDFLNKAFKKEFDQQLAQNPYTSKQSYYLFIEKSSATGDLSTPTYKLVRKERDTDEIFPEFLQDYQAFQAESKQGTELPSTSVYIIKEQEERSTLNERGFKEENERLMKTITEKCQAANAELYYKNLGARPTRTKADNERFYGICTVFMMVAVVASFTVSLALATPLPLLIIPIMALFYTYPSISEYFMKKRFDKKEKSNPSLKQARDVNINQLIREYEIKLGLTPDEQQTPGSTPAMVLGQQPDERVHNVAELPPAPISNRSSSITPPDK